MQSLTVIVFSLLAPALATPVATSLRVNTTTNGLVVGHQAANRTSVVEFLGIRYAEAPTGALRFGPPKRFAAPPGTTYEASKWVSEARNVGPKKRSVLTLKFHSHRTSSSCGMSQKLCVLTAGGQRLPLQQATHVQLPEFQ